MYFLRGRFSSEESIAPKYRAPPPDCFCYVVILQSRERFGSLEQLFSKVYIYKKKKKVTKLELDGIVFCHLFVICR